MAREKRRVTKVEIGVGDQALTKNNLEEGTFLKMATKLAESKKGTWMKVTSENGQVVIRKSEDGYELLMGSDLY